MCGLAGVIDEKGLTPEEISLFEEVCRSRLEARGPDEQNVVSTSSSFLYHSRLVINGGTKGRQPLDLGNGRYLLYNGEIYSSPTFSRSNSGKVPLASGADGDTAFVAGLLRDFEEPPLGELEGAYAVAVHDTESSCVKLWRDPLGLKPLYFGMKSGRFAYASDSYVVAKLLGISSLKPEGVALYLSLGYIPEEYSPFEGVHQVNLGEKITYEDARVSARIHAPMVSENHIRGWRSAVEEVIPVFEEYVTTSNSPPALFLSTGEDSNALAVADLGFSVAIFGHTRRGLMTHLDDGIKIRRLARHHGLDIVFGSYKTDLSEAISGTIRHYTSPQSYSSFRSVAGLSTIASDHGIKCALTGDGADEIFGGYGWNSRDGLNCGTPWWQKGLLSQDMIMAGIARDASGNLALEKASNLHPRFSLDEIAAVSGLTNRRVIELLEQHVLFSSADLSYMSERQISRIRDLRTFGIGHGAQKVDNMGLGFGVELRTPFLDRRLLGISLSRIADSEIDGACDPTKWLQRSMFDSSVERLLAKTKIGFSRKTKPSVADQIASAAELATWGLEVEGILEKPTKLKNARTHASLMLSRWLSEG